MAQTAETATRPESSMNGRPTTATLPKIAAAFLVRFDNRKGYVLTWQRSIDHLTLDGVVEFKSLPSGLHNVKEDLVYFVHDQYVGASAFLNCEDKHDDRKARMLSVGVLVPLESGRMGKSWFHADRLKELCRQQVQNLDDYSALEKYWEENKLPSSSQHEDDDEEPGKTSDGGPKMKIDLPKQPAGYQMSRSMSVGAVSLPPNHTLPHHHPALALPQFLSLFGPLILPLYRAALLRKRILILGEAPVEQTCNIVYNLSILSSIPRIVAESILLESPHDVRLQPLFNVGITDISDLSARKPDSSTPSSEVEDSPGWIACTTDDVLCTKPDLFDLLVILPNGSSLHPSSRQYPKLILSSSELSKAAPKYGIRASQRDARRYAALTQGIRSIPSSSPAENCAISDNDEEDEEDIAGAETASTTSAASAVSRKSIVEPQSWSQIAYTSLVWWASAGDKRAGLTEAEENENEQDLALLGTDVDQGINGVDVDEDEGGNDGRTREVAVVSYFHRLSGLIFQVLEQAVRRSNSSNSQNEDRYRDDSDQPDYLDETEETSPHHPQRKSHQQSSPDNEPLLGFTSQRSHDRNNNDNDNDEDNDDDSDEPVEITPEDVTNMGLNVWSSTDRKFIEEMMQFWFGREAVVLGGKVECCGLRIV